jgi:hypothetical protein
MLGNGTCVEYKGDDQIFVPSRGFSDIGEGIEEFRSCCKSSVDTGEGGLQEVGSVWVEIVASFSQERSPPSSFPFICDDD